MAPEVGAVSGAPPQLGFVFRSHFVLLCYLSRVLCHVFSFHLLEFFSLLYTALLKGSLRFKISIAIEDL